MVDDALKSVPMHERRFDKFDMQIEKKTVTKDKNG